MVGFFGRMGRGYMGWTARHPYLGIGSAVGIGALGLTALGGLAGLIGPGTTGGGMGGIWSGGFGGALRGGTLGVLAGGAIGGVRGYRAGLRGFKALGMRSGLGVLTGGKYGFGIGAGLGAVGGAWRGGLESNRAVNQFSGF